MVPLLQWEISGPLHQKWTDPKSRKADITEFNRPNNQLNIFDIYRGLYSKTEDYAFL